jgi:hypothetical protein
LAALRFLIALANAPFTMAAGVAAVFALLQVTGLLGLIAGHGDADHDVDAEPNVDADADAGDADAAGDAQHDSDADHDHGAHGDRSPVLAALGFGTIPISIIWQSFCLAFAIAGLALNSAYLGSKSGPPLYTLAWTVPVSLLAGYVGTAAITRILGPLLSSKGQEATSRAQLVGQIGVVISSKVDREFGEVRIHDKTGHDVRVVCRLAERAAKVPTERQQVVVVEYDPERGALFVEPLEYGDLGDEARKG